jgi:hypothetical protein
VFQPTEVGIVGRKSAYPIHRSNVETIPLFHLTLRSSNFKQMMAVSPYRSAPSNQYSTLSFWILLNTHVHLHFYSSCMLEVRRCKTLVLALPNTRCMTYYQCLSYQKVALQSLPANGASHHSKHRLGLLLFWELGHRQGPINKLINLFYSTDPLKLNTSSFQVFELGYTFPQCTRKAPR